MKLETLITKMMTLNVQARLWHWMTDKAQHHTAFEQFLTQNETFTDSFVESAMGNDIKVDLSAINIKDGHCQDYSIETAKSELKNYRLNITEAKGQLEKSDVFGTEELITILDDVVELSSKTLYLLKLT